jgi:ornithine cyclodeaminase/alanine dehydrogenase-like protein (mu-crystallin family)
MPILLREEDISNVLSLKDVVEAVEDGFRQYGLDLAQTKQRREVRIKGKELRHADPRMVRISQGLAFLEESGVVVLHHIFSFPGKTIPAMRVVNHLVNANDGSILAVIDSVSLLGLRTGAAGAVGAKYLSQKDSKVAGLIGTGRQGRIQLRFLLQVRNIEKAYAYSLVPLETAQFCKEMTSELGIDVIASNDIEQVAKKADILVTTTFSTNPIVKASWLSPGIHVNIIGADDLPKIELEGAALKRADKLVIAAEDCFETGQMRIPIEEGIINKEDVYGNIGQIIAGLKPGRERTDEVTIFHSPGITLQDAAISYRAYLKAKELGIGKNISDPFLFPPT